MAAPARPSPLGQKPVTAQDAVQSHILVHGNIQPWAGRDVAQAASHTQPFAPLPPPHNLQHSLLRGAIDPYLIMERDRARAKANVVAATDINQDTGSLPLNSGSPSPQQASTERSRKRKAPEVERGNLVSRLRKKTKAEPASSTLEIEPIPRPFTPTSADTWLLFAVLLLCNAQDAVPLGGVLPGDVPGIPANEDEDVAVTGAIHGSTGNIHDYESLMIAIQTSLDQSLLPVPASFSGPSISSQTTFGPTPVWDLPPHVNPINPQDLVASIRSVSTSFSHQSAPMTSSDIPALKPETRWQDIAADSKEESCAEVESNGMLDLSAAALSDDAFFPGWVAFMVAFTAPVVCRSWNSVIKNTIELQYRIELGSHNVRDSCPRDMTTDERLRLLKTGQMAWRTLDIEKLVPITRLIPISLYNAVFTGDTVAHVDFIERKYVLKNLYADGAYAEEVAWAATIPQDTSITYSLVAMDVDQGLLAAAFVTSVEKEEFVYFYEK
ncbi:hypothetical protein EWM64_g2914 [Hericium alpestre]|uniref:Uncharacterized protein n=1 Tax=Hericium alpestre TaxID=135208 RepID=A0A4Z0A2X6_9AGAM|nr:hypothetical protein EWM64_g2914 [Hericium alpestre]